MQYSITVYIRPFDLLRSHDIPYLQHCLVVQDNACHSLASHLHYLKSVFALDRRGSRPWALACQLTSVQLFPSRALSVYPFGTVFLKSAARTRCSMSISQAAACSMAGRPVPVRKAQSNAQYAKAAGTTRDQSHITIWAMTIGYSSGRSEICQILDTDGPWSQSRRGKSHDSSRTTVFTVTVVLARESLRLAFTTRV